jgi:lipopolysaccharide biosynthesis glycosyltransferase
MPGDGAISPKRPVQVALAADAAFAMPLAVTLTSLALTHRRNELAITVLHDGLSKSDVARVEEGPPAELDLSWRRVEPAEVAGAHFCTFLTRASLFRLLLPQILPDLTRVIYLDCDTVVTGSLQGLWEADLGGLPVGAVRDAGSPFAAGPLGTEWCRLGLEPDTPYFNTGVLALALDEWRATDLSARTLGLLRARRPRWGDQDGLNAILRGHWRELPRAWNLQTADATGEGLAWALWREDVERASADPAVVHFTERAKPWHATCPHPYASQWRAVLEESGWRGWRPRDHRSLGRRAVARAALARRAFAAGRLRGS